MKLILAQLISITFAVYAVGQSFDPAHYKDKAPRNIGPAGMTGRITAIDEDRRRKLISNRHGDRNKCRILHI